MPIKKAAVLATVPGAALALTPAARWGHQAVYVSSQQAMYVVGGEVSSFGNQITNEVLVLPLNTSSPSFALGPSDSLPPHAFASMTIGPHADYLAVVGGMTTSCGTDAVAHYLDLSSGSWSNINPTSLVRRRGAGAVWVDNNTSKGEMLLVGGVADKYSCSSTTYAFPATDVLQLPFTERSLISTRQLPTSLTGDTLAVSDFALTQRSADGAIFLAGGQSASGDLVSLGTVGMWSKDAGWTSQTTSGDVPTGRVGATMVAHPTLDILVLHGGSDSNDQPSSLVAFLNTTSWTWSTPSNLQPPSSSAAAYHSSVMTPSGVMITAFGSGPSGARSDVYYLDMRDPSGSAWTWKSVWSADMLNNYTSTSTTSTTTNTSAVSGSGGKTDSKKVTTIVVPVIIGALILIPLMIWFVRRRVRIARKRRMARHFDFGSSEDAGDFSSPLAQFKGMVSSGRKTKTQHAFGRDANEKDGNVFTDAVGFMRRVTSRASTASGSSSSEHSVEREMQQVVGTRATVQRLNEKSMKWEEIDFGLGKLDEDRNKSQVNVASRRSSFSDSPPAPGIASTFDAYEASAQQGQLLVHIHEPPTADSDSPRVGTPRHDGQLPLLGDVPAVNILPPTPAVSLDQYPALAPQAPGQDEWASLEQTLADRPAFRSISPTSTLRSHAHSSPVQSTPTQAFPVPAPSGPAPRLPSLDFERPSITLVNPKTGRRTSQPSPSSPSSLPFASSPPRVVSNPVRQLAGGGGRRGSAPFVSSPFNRPDSPLSAGASSGSTTPTASARPVSYDGAVRRASQPNVGQWAQGSLNGRRGSALRVVNVGQDEADLQGQAI